MTTWSLSLSLTRTRTHTHTHALTLLFFFLTFFRWNQIDSVGYFSIFLLKFLAGDFFFLSLQFWQNALEHENWLFWIKQAIFFSVTVENNYSRVWLFLHKWIGLKQFLFSFLSFLLKRKTAVDSLRMQFSFFLFFSPQTKYDSLPHSNF